MVVIRAAPFLISILCALDLLFLPLSQRSRNSTKGSPNQTRSALLKHIVLPSSVAAAMLLLLLLHNC
jgi:hypothetical protein